MKNLKYINLRERIHIIMTNVEINLVDHPALSKRIANKLEKIKAELGDIYRYADDKVKQ